MPRSFSLMPTPYLHWRYIYINAKTLTSLTKTKSDGNYQGNVNAFYSFSIFKSSATIASKKLLTAKTSSPALFKATGSVSALVLLEKLKMYKKYR